MSGLKLHRVLRASFHSFHWFAIGCLLLLSGCGEYYGESEFEAVRGEQSSFNDLIKAAGGSAELKGQSAFGFEAAGWFINLKGATITDELLDAIIKAYAKNPVFQLDLSKSTITDAELEKLDEAKVLQKVFKLDLSETGITDAGLDKLDHLHCIMELNLTGSQATAAGGKRLGQRKVASPQTPKPMKKSPKVQV